ncbi:hypothetical protein Sya03_57680 [Spirilliplanes yamanashiensis]|uniref:Uncharacterized protein n=1 Tax=Spirilliplanes yamanashiensis TaxID=42233 RepID=A0A8J4DLX2_9ACTN|nr:hypothetical protein Sya03_57680 [Spirilliplanes yamanashiensis]
MASPNQPARGPHADLVAAAQLLACTQVLVDEAHAELVTAQRAADEAAAAAADAAAMVAERNAAALRLQAELAGDGPPRPDRAEAVRASC